MAALSTVWSFNDQFFASLVNCIVWRAFSEYWRKENEESAKVFLWGGRFGSSLLCPGRAEKDSRGSWPTAGCFYTYLPTETNLVPIRGVMGKEFDTFHTHAIKALWTARSTAADVTLGKNKLLCWSEPLHGREREA